MTDILLIIIVLFFVIKLVIFGPLLYFVFRDDIRQYFAQRGLPSPPTCPLCRSRYAQPTDDARTQWEGEDLVLVTGYECEHCHYPFWHVERVSLTAPPAASNPSVHGPLS